MFFFFFKQKTAYEMRISDWSSDVCLPIWLPDVVRVKTSAGRTATCVGFSLRPTAALNAVRALKVREQLMSAFGAGRAEGKAIGKSRRPGPLTMFARGFLKNPVMVGSVIPSRSEEPTSELQSIMRISYAV